MRQKKISKNIGQSSSSVWFLLSSVSAVTLLFKTDFYDPFNSAKLILLLALDGWLIGHLVNSYRDRPVKFRSSEFNFTALLFSFIICLLISTFFTDEILVGLIGTTQRRNGFLSYLGLGVIMLFAARSICFSNIMRVYKVGIITGALLSTYGLVQISGNDFVRWDNPYNSMISTLGNPNFASALLAVLFLLGLYGAALKNLPNIFKFLSIYLGISALIAIVISGSRQGLLVIIFSAIFYLSIYSILTNKKNRFFISSFLGAIGVLTLLGMLQIGPLTSMVYKESISIRGYYWRAGIEMFKDSPLTGVGVDQYGTFFKAFNESSYSLKYGNDISSSNAHNTFIQLFATAGIFVGILYLILVAYIFFVAINLLKKSDRSDQKIILGLLCTWLGFQAQSLISIDNIGISIWGWLLGGSILGLKFNREKNLEQVEIGQERLRKSRQIKINVLQPIISTTVLVPILIFGTLFYRVEQNLFILKGISSPEFPQNKQPVLQLVNKVLNNPMTDYNYKYRSAFFLFDMGYLDEAYEVVLEVHLNEPRDPVFLKGLALIEESRGNIKGVISAREQMSIFDPWNTDNYLALLKLYKNNGDLNNATAMKDKIISFAPGTEIAKTAIEIFG